MTKAEAIVEASTEAAIVAKLESRISIRADGCWIWQGARQSQGYGTIYIGRRDDRYWTVLVHRLAYTIKKGPCPTGLELDHLCRVPLCVNPEHLEPVTHRENMRRGRFGMKDHCIHGHPYDGMRHRTRDCRMCRVCENSYRREWKRRKRAKQRAGIGNVISEREEAGEAARLPGAGNVPALYRSIRGRGVEAGSEGERQALPLPEAGPAVPGRAEGQRR